MNKNLEERYSFRQFHIPVRMMPGLKRYLEDHIPPGDFLKAVIQNDLKEACARADDENIINLPAYVAYLYNHAPIGSWGSINNYKNWIAKKGY